MRRRRRRRAPAPRLRLGQADAAELRVGEDRRRQHRVVGAPRAVAEHVLDRDARLVLRDRREHRARLRRRPRPRSRRRSCACGRRRRCRRVPTSSPIRSSSQLLDVRHAPRGEQDVRHRRSCRSPSVASMPSPVRGERVDAAVQDDLDSLVLERRLQLARRLRVRACRDLRAAVHDRHARAEAREDLRELEPDRPRADDEQRLGHVVELERADVVEPVDVLDARDRRDGRAAAGGDEDPVGRSARGRRRGRSAHRRTLAVARERRRSPRRSAPATQLCWSRRSESFHARVRARSSVGVRQIDPTLALRGRARRA